MEKNLSQATPNSGHPVQDFPCGVCYLSSQGEISYVNAQMERFLGHPASALIGTALADWVESDPGFVPGKLDKLLTAGTLRLRVRASQLWLACHMSVRRDAGEDHPEFIAVCGPSSSTTDKLSALELTARTVAHEIRNHLSAIKMSLYMLEKSNPLQHDDALHFSIANEELKRIELFLRDLVGYTRPHPPRMERVALSDVVHQALDAARPALALKSISLSRQLPAPGPQLEMDRDQIVRALTQTIQNACEALPRGGSVRVAIKPDPERRHWCVEIEDNGPGIPLADQPQVFEPFFSTRSHQLGLGLSSVRQTLHAHRGSVWFESDPGQGTTFTLSLPSPARGSEANHG